MEALVGAVVYQLAAVVHAKRQQRCPATQRAAAVPSVVDVDPAIAVVTTVDAIAVSNAVAVASIAGDPMRTCKLDYVP